MKRKQVNIVTYCSWASLGSILQSFALGETLNNHGCSTTILLEDWNRRRETHRPRNLKGLIRYFYEKIVDKKIKEAFHKRMDFISTNMNMEYLYRYEDFIEKRDLQSDDIYLAGSDQIWHPDICQKHFFLEFVRNGKCVSYAASMGKTEIPSENVERFRSMLARLDHISVREVQCKEVLQPLTEKDIGVHIDPTFLLEKETWRKYEKQYPIREPYILLYMIYWDPACKEQICELKKRTGLPVYAICSGLSRIYADKKLFDVGVGEFLWLIDHAEYVITSSFHGVALSTIFNKKFAAVLNPASPSRIRNLLDTLNIPEVRIRELDGTDRFDYSMICERISEERRRGMEYLKEVIDE